MPALAALPLRSPAPRSGIDHRTALEAAAVGVSLALYRFDHYRGEAAPESANGRDVESVQFVGAEISRADSERALRRATAVARGVNLARDLGNEPASTLTPEEFANRAEAVAQESDLEIEVLGPPELAAIGAAATLAVGGGSVNTPRLIRLRYRPAGNPAGSQVVGLVGKAITFDTGGYSIKPYEGMLEMKGDMAGGAAVLGAMSALRDLDCPTPVEATICAAENMISGTAFRPGDVIRGMNGVTMEILSTDAEGRLVLADGLVDTARRGATELIDLATLTGAAVVALGDGTTALFATDDDLADRLLDSADEHRRADVAHAADRRAGAQDRRRRRRHQEHRRSRRRRDHGRAFSEALQRGAAVGTPRHRGIRRARKKRLRSVRKAPPASAFGPCCAISQPARRDGAAARSWRRSKFGAQDDPGARQRQQNGQDHDDGE